MQILPLNQNQNSKINFKARVCLNSQDAFVFEDIIKQINPKAVRPLRKFLERELSDIDIDRYLLNGNFYYLSKKEEKLITLLAEAVKSERYTTARIKAKMKLIKLIQSIVKKATTLDEFKLKKANDKMQNIKKAMSLKSTTPEDTEKAKRNLLSKLLDRDYPYNWN